MWKVFALLAVLAMPLYASEISKINDAAKKLFEKDSKPQEKASEWLFKKLKLDLGLSQEQAQSRPTSLLDAGYSVTLEETKECNPWAEDLLKNDNEYAKTIQKQVEDAAMFLADYHFRMMGRNDSFYKVRDVVICTHAIHWTSPEMAFDRVKAELRLNIGPKRLLAVGPSRFRKNNLHPIDPKELRESWNDGDHWKKDLSVQEIIDAKKNPERANWSFLNPIGNVRTIVRELVVAAGVPAASEIRTLIKDDLKALRERIGADATAAPEATVRRLGEEWAKKLEAPTTADSVAFAAVNTTMKASVKRKQIGLVNVENLHQIGVFVADEVKDFESQMKAPDELSIEVTQIGAVNVSTTDQVKVVAALKALASPAVIAKGALKSVLREQKK